MYQKNIYFRHLSAGGLNLTTESAPTEGEGRLLLTYAGCKQFGLSTELD